MPVPGRKWKRAFFALYSAATLPLAYLISGNLWENGTLEEALASGTLELLAPESGNCEVFKLHTVGTTTDEDGNTVAKLPASSHWRMFDVTADTDPAPEFAFTDKVWAQYESSFGDNS